MGGAQIGIWHRSCLWFLRLLQSLEAQLEMASQGGLVLDLAVGDGVKLAGLNRESLVHSHLLWLEEISSHGGLEELKGLRFRSQRFHFFPLVRANC